jgi:DNA-binding CsgD family transcriptional regulator
MFGTELHLITLLYIIVELLVLLVLFAACISRPKDESRTRFFILTLLFLTYNLFSGLFPDDHYPIPLLLQNILAYTSGISLASYYFYYLVKELNIQGEKFFNAKLLFLSLIGIFLIGFVPMYLITGDVVLSKQTFIVLPLIITVYFCVRTIIFIFNSTDRKKSHQRHHKILTFSGYFGIIFMASMPIVVFFGDYQTINIGLVNISFVLSAIAFLKAQLYQSRMEYNALKNIGYFSQDVVGEELELEPLPSPILVVPLTEKEAEVAELIMENLTYREISERLFIAERTASKHASNIFRKTECKCKKEFIDKYALTNS